MKIKTTSYLNILIIILTILGFAMVSIVTIFEKSSEQHFIHLSYAFLHKKTYFITPLPNLGDTTSFLGHTYWPLGPFPAVLLMPFVSFFGLQMEQKFLLLPLTILNWILLYRIGIHMTNSRENSFWMAFAYIFSSSYIGITLISWSWYFAQVIATSLTLLFLDEICYGKKWWLLGVYTGLAIATRTTMVGISLFSLLHILRTCDTPAKKLSACITYSIPIAISIFLLFSYNYVRFGSFIEQGYSKQTLYDPLLLKNIETKGVWNIAYIPTNLYYATVSSPIPIFQPGTRMLTFPYIKPNLAGMSLLYTSPIFLWCININWRKKYMVESTIAALAVLFFVLGYYAGGFKQYGYRYALDLQPFLFFMLLSQISKKITALQKIVIIFSFLFNTYLLQSFFS